MDKKEAAAWAVFVLGIGYVMYKTGRVPFVQSSPVGCVPTVQSSKMGCVPGVQTLPWTDEIIYEGTSTGDHGEVLYYEARHVSRNGNGSIAGPGQNYPFFTGGTFIRPDYLPPPRTYQLQ